MIQMSISEIQKQTSIFNNLKEAIEVFDKRQKKKVAFIYPAQSGVSILTKAGKYSGQVEKNKLSFKEIKKEAINLAMKEKYGLST